MYAYLPSALIAFLFKQLFKITELKRINKYLSAVKKKSIISVHRSKSDSNEGRYLLPIG